MSWRNLERDSAEGETVDDRNRPTGPNKKIYRIVHISKPLCEKHKEAGGRYGEVCRAILALHEAGEEVRHIDRLDKVDDLAGMPRNVKIFLGGGLKEVCVSTHLEALLAAGLMNVDIDPLITLTERDVILQPIVTTRSP